MEKLLQIETVTAGVHHHVMASKNAWEQVVRRAARQHGLIDWSQALAAGMTRTAIETCLAKGVFERVCSRVYRIAGSPPTWRQQVMAAVLSAGPDAAASHRAAVRIWGLDAPVPRVAEITMPRTRAVELVGVTTHRTGDLVAADVTTRDGIPVTTVPRTLVDLGAVSPRWVVDRCIDAALARRLVALEDLWRILRRVSRRGRRGAGVLRACLEWRFGVPDSVLEGLFLEIVRDFGLPEPVVQYEVQVNGRLRKIDAAYPERSLAIELDGAKKRMSPESLQADDSRQNDLVEARFTPLRFTWTDLTSGRELVARKVLTMYHRLPVVAA